MDDWIPLNWIKLIEVGWIWLDLAGSIEIYLIELNLTWIQLN